MTGAIVILTTLAVIAATALSFATRWLPANQDSLTNEINRLLPQTQCAQCGYPGCRPYADAVARGDVDIDRCTPGGDDLVRSLARLLGRQNERLHPQFQGDLTPQVAVIDESRCIGCALCLKACPVDAIIGAHEFMHTVISDECTGCELCIAPCPVDCISLQAAAAPEY